MASKSNTANNTNGAFAHKNWRNNRNVSHNCACNGTSVKSLNSKNDFSTIYSNSHVDIVKLLIL